VGGVRCGVSVLLLACLAAGQDRAPVVKVEAKGLGVVLQIPGARGGRFDVADPVYGEGLAFAEGAAAILFEEPPAALVRVDVADGALGVTWGVALDGEGRLAWWVDENRGTAVVIGKDRSVTALALADGAISHPGPEVVWTALALPWAASRALEAAVELLPPDTVAVAGPVARDPKAPVALRFRAALAVQRAGGARIPPALLEAAVAETEDIGDRRYAVRHAPEILGDAAPAWLERRGVEKDLSRAAIDALATLGDTGIASLVYLMTHSKVTPDARVAAMGALRGAEGRAAVLDAVLKEMRDAEPEVAGLLLQTAIATGAPDLHARIQPYERALLKILDHQTADVTWLADYFRDLPTTEAVQPLLKALARYRADIGRRDRIIAALKACTGRDLGRDPQAWLAAFGGR